MKKRILIPLIVIAAFIVALIVYSAAGEKEASVILTTEAKKGMFEILITVTGELQAESSVEIKAPSELRSRSSRLRTIKIQNLIAEGTVVDSGDWVATLDRSEADNALKDIMDQLEKRETEYSNAILDTTIQLRQLRNELINLKFNMEEQKIALEQSQYEPPATIRQAQINLDKATRAYEQAIKNYELKEKQAVADIREVALNLAREQRTRDEMYELLQKFDIYAPAPGMVIYQKEWNGQKRTVGAEISPWDLTVATLPDLTTLVSKTYVNEIDISKIKEGQQVRVGVDAFPEKQFTGVVTDVANIGEQLPNTDAKVFEVVIRLNERDPILRPSMTTSNQIITNVYEDVIHIPLEALNTNDSVSFVFTKKHTRQIVMLGESNENLIIVEEGLSARDELYLSIPENSENYKFTGIELVEKIKLKKAEEEARAKEASEQAHKMMSRPRQPGGGGRNFQRPSK